MGIFEMVVAVSGITGGCAVGATAVWAKLKYDAESKAESLPARRKIDLLTTENDGLKGQVSRLEERISVLERIATDPAQRVAREIENLR
jgi:hypothetical protein